MTSEMFVVILVWGTFWDAFGVNFGEPDSRISMQLGGKFRNIFIFFWPKLMDYSYLQKCLENINFLKSKNKSCDISCCEWFRNSVKLFVRKKASEMYSFTLFCKNENVVQGDRNLGILNLIWYHEIMLQKSRKYRHHDTPICEVKLCGKKLTSRSKRRA